MREFMKARLIRQRVYRVDRNRPLAREPEAVAVHSVKGNLLHLQRSERALSIPGGYGLLRQRLPVRLAKDKPGILVNEARKDFVFGVLILILDLALDCD